MKVIIGEKKEMTQLYSEDGAVIPVTIIDVNNVVVATKKDAAKDGYNAIVLGTGKQKSPNKPDTKNFEKLGFVPAKLVEAKTEGESTYNVGDKLEASQFSVNEKVDVSGVTKGKGFQGVVKRWGFAGGPKTHGQSDRHRAPGSIGAGTNPGRVVKGRKMPGRTGAANFTVKNLKVVHIDAENGLIAVKGAVPGNKGSLVIIKTEK